MNAVPVPTHVLLSRMQAGDRAAVDRLLQVVYDDLRAAAHHQLRHERDGHTLNTTALVHEAYLRLVDQRAVVWHNRAHFVAVAAQAMRRVLVDYARRRRAAKRGGPHVHLVSLEALDGPRAPSERLLRGVDLDEMIALDDALDRLAAFNERGCRVVEYRVFGGLTHEEIALVLGCSSATVRRAWSAARAWLRHELSPSDP